MTSFADGETGVVAEEQKHSNGLNDIEHGCEPAFLKAQDADMNMASPTSSEGFLEWINDSDQRYVSQYSFTYLRFLYSSQRMC